MARLFTRLTACFLLVIGVALFLASPAARAQGIIIQDDFSQPNYDTGSHNPYNVYDTKIWDGAPGGLGLPPNYQTTPGHTNLGADAPGGVWQFAGGADQDYDVNEIGNLAGYGASSLVLTGGTSAVPYAYCHNNETIGITTVPYNISATLTVTVNVTASTTGTAYVGFDSALDVSNNFSGLAFSGTTGSLALIVAGSQVGSAVTFTGSYSNATASQLSFSVNTTTGAISNVTLQGSTSTYNFSTSGFTQSATQYFAVGVSNGGNAGADFAALTIQSSTFGGPPVISSALTATATNGIPYSYQIAAINSPTSYNATNLPTGLGVNTSTGIISGTATVTGTSDVTISAANASGTGTATLVLTVLPPAPVITSTLAATGTAGKAFSYQIIAANGPTSFGAIGLPASLSVKSSTGLISGMVSASGTSDITLTASSPSGTGTATLVLGIAGGVAVTGTQVAAVRVNDFLSSIGANIHDDQDGSDSIYTSMIQYCQVRNVRAGDGQAAGQVTLHNATIVSGTYPGVMFDILCGGGSNIANDLSDARTVYNAGALLSLEGPNEPNNEPFTYNGALGGGTNTWLPVARFQNALYIAAKADSVLGTAGANIPVFDISEPGAEVNNVGLQFLSTSGSSFADYANCHNYVDPIVDNYSWANASPNEPDTAGASDSMSGEYFGVTWNKHFTALTLGTTPIPMVSTEFGWSTSTSDTDVPVTQDEQGKLVINQYLSQYARGWKYSFVYELRDSDGGNVGFGFFTSSGAPKLSGQYVANLTTILSDDSSAFTPGSLDFSIPSPPATVHSMLMQHANGRYELAIWDDRPVGEATDTITVDFAAGSYASLNIYDPTVGTSPIQTPTNASSVSLSLTDHPVILDLPAVPIVTSTLTATGTYSNAFSYQIAGSNGPTLFSATGLPPGLGINTATGIISGTPAATGSGGITISAANASGTATATLNLTIVASFAGWQNYWFSPAQIANPAISGATATPAGDSLPNLLKYALNLDPLLSATSGLPVGSTVAISGDNYLTISYTELIGAADVTYIPQVSGDLQTWNSGPGYISQISATNNFDGLTETVVVQDLTPVSQGVPRYIRLMITGAF